MKGLLKRFCICGVGVTLLLTGCGGSGGNKGEASYAQDSNTIAANPDIDTGMGMYYFGEVEDYAGTESAAPQEAGSGTNSGSQDVREGRKLIRTVQLSVETLEFDSLLDYVQNKTAELGGYVENISVYNGSGYDPRYYEYSGNGGYGQRRNASMVLRIPKENLDGFLTEVDVRGNVISRSEQEEDVTLDYVDLESHKKVLQAEQERLLEMMEQAQTMDDLITLESRLSDIRYQLESMESRLRTYDNQIEYATVYLDLNEVVELTPVEEEEQTIWERMGEGFMESLAHIGTFIKEFFVYFVISLPYLILLLILFAVVIWFVFFLVKRGQKKSGTPKQQKSADKEDERKNE